MVVTITSRSTKLEIEVALKKLEQVYQKRVNRKKKFSMLLNIVVSLS